VNNEKALYNEGHVYETRHIKGREVVEGGGQMKRVMEGEYG
jgi:hypothetical protein